MWWEHWESFALSYSQCISLLPSWDSSITWMFSVFSSQELAQLFVVNNIHRSFDPENPYVWEQPGTWKQQQQQQLFIWHKHIPESYIYTYYWKIIINMVPD